MFQVILFFWPAFHDQEICLHIQIILQGVIGVLNAQAKWEDDNTQYTASWVRQKFT